LAASDMFLASFLDLTGLLRPSIFFMANEVLHLLKLILFFILLLGFNELLSI
jgi:hypothetical protein